MYGSIVLQHCTGALLIVYTYVCTQAGSNWFPKFSQIRKFTSFLGERSWHIARTSYENLCRPFNGRCFLLYLFRQIFFFVELDLLTLRDAKLPRKKQTTKSHRSSTPYGGGLKNTCVCTNFGSYLKRKAWSIGFLCGKHEYFICCLLID